MLPVRLFSRECDGEMNWAGECGAEDVLGVGDVVQECVVVDDAELFVRVWLGDFTPAVKSSVWVIFGEYVNNGVRINTGIPHATAASMRLGVWFNSW